MRTAKIVLGILMLLGSFAVGTSGFILFALTSGSEGHVTAQGAATRERLILIWLVVTGALFLGSVVLLAWGIFGRQPKGPDRVSELYLGGWDRLAGTSFFCGLLAACVVGIHFLQVLSLGLAGIGTLCLLLWLGYARNRGRWDIGCAVLGGVLCSWVLTSAFVPTIAVNPIGPLVRIILTASRGIDQEPSGRRGGWESPRQSWAWDQTLLWHV